MKDLKKFNITFKNKTRPVYKKRTKKNGEEFLKKVDEIDIEEDLKEKQLEINRIKEIFNTQERLKSKELIEEITTEEFLEELKTYQNYNSQMELHEFLNMTREIEEFYNKMPQDIRMKYKDLSKFTKEYIPSFIDEQSIKLKNRKQAQAETIKAQANQQTQEELKKQIEELQTKLTKEGVENV